MQTQRKIGFFGGSFDPIHFGHLNLAVQIIEKEGLDEVFFSVAALSPHKREEPPTSSKEARRAMVEIAIKPFEKFTLIDSELQREGPSYTIDTLRELMVQDRKAQFRLIIGSDMLEGLSQWKDVETLLKMAPPLIGSRPIADQFKFFNSRFSSELLEIIKAGMVSTPIMEISSTEIRQRLHQRKICRHWVPGEVLDYIAHHGLYL
jgi:nicotinate-nucleotide adenylyltransferase